MANETTFALIKQYLPEVWENALFYAKANFVMPGLVQTFTNLRSMVARNVTEYEQGSVNEDLGELEDLTPQQLTRRLLAQLVPAEHGMQYLVSDRRVEGDDESVLADAAMEIGYQMGKHIESKLLADMANFTGGSVGTAGQALSWSDVYSGRARLAAAHVPGPYNVVLHEYQWLDLATAANIAASTVAHSMQFRDTIQSQYYVGSQGDMNFYVSAEVPIDSSDDATGGIFNRQALALDLRRGLRLEPERDASLRATEINATMIYAHGVWRPSYGVKLVSDATAPGSDVTVNSDVQIIGTIDDATPAVGQDSEFTFVIVNRGTQIARGVTVTFTKDSNWTYLSDDESQGTFNSSTLVWTAGDLVPGASARIRLIMDATTSGSSKVVTGTVAVDDPADNVAGNNVATVTATIS